MKISLYVLFIIILIALDQTSKFWTLLNMNLGGGVNINSIFSLTYVHNYGASFGFLSNEDGWQRYFLSGFSIVVVSALIIWLVKSIQVSNNALCLSLSLLIAGALGNLFDRVYHGFVIDFIHLHYNSFNFPVFNFADIFISLAILMLISQEIRHKD